MLKSYGRRSCYKCVFSCNRSYVVRRSSLLILLAYVACDQPLIVHAPCQAHEIGYVCTSRRGHAESYGYDVEVSRAHVHRMIWLSVQLIFPSRACTHSRPICCVQKPLLSIIWYWLEDPLHTYIHTSPFQRKNRRKNSRGFRGDDKIRTEAGQCPSLQVYCELSSPLLLPLTSHFSRQIAQPAIYTFTIIDSPFNTNPKQKKPDAILIETCRRPIMAGTKHMKSDLVVIFCST